MADANALSKDGFTKMIEDMDTDKSGEVDQVRGILSNTADELPRF